ncbi:MAG: hypothetical protein ACREDZ_06540 [Kiloniellales bacterium]
MIFGSLVRKLGRRLERQAVLGVLGLLAALILCLSLVGGLGLLLAAGYLVLLPKLGAPAALASIGVLILLLAAAPLVILYLRYRKPRDEATVGPQDKPVATAASARNGDVAEIGLLIGRSLANLGPTGMLLLTAGLGAAVVLAADREGEKRHGKKRRRNTTQADSWNGAGRSEPLHPPL